MAHAIVQRSYSPIGMAYVPLNSARCVGLRSISSMVAFTSIAPRVGSKVCIRCMGQSYERCDHCKARALMCSPQRLALRSLQPGSCGWCSVQGALQNFPSLCTHTCSDILADTSSRTMAMTRVRWRTISGIAICNQRLGTPRSRRIGSRGFGKTEIIGVAITAPGLRLRLKRIHRKVSF